jgi:hypothetical protein
MPDTAFTPLFGWAGTRVADEAWEQVGVEMPKFQIAGSSQSFAGQSFRAWEFARKVFGKDIDRVVQLTGDCVSRSSADVCEWIQCIEIANGDRESFKRILCSYNYATSRVLVGKNQLRGGAGSVGSWMAKAIQQYGLLADDFSGTPDYSGKLSDAWGDDKPYNGIKFNQFIDEGDNHPIRTVSRITKWDDLRDAICNGHLATISSNRGYAYKPDSDGFHRPSGSWSHQMGIVAISDNPSKSWVGISNQWGDMFGHLNDFETGEPWPIGMLRVRRDDFEKHHLTSSAECFVYSSFDGFPDRSSELTGLLI